MDTFPDVPRLPYAQVRPLIRSGDFLLCSGSSPMSLMIQRATDSIFSHAAFLRWDREIDRVMVLESVESVGTQTIPLSFYVSNYKQSGRPYPGRIYIARHAGLTSEIDLVPMFQWATDQLNLPYDTQEILRIALRITAAKLGLPYQPYAQDKIYICSEFLLAWLAQGAITMACDQRGFFAPADVARCAEVQILWELALKALEADAE
jgi:hypothetical protein